MTHLHHFLRYAVSLSSLAWLATPLTAVAVDLPVTAEQRATADQVAQAGVALSELAENAPERYTVKRGDTLWDISRLFLKRPWRWPELWGMNKAQIQNPHLIYPGQVLVLVKANGRATLQVGEAVGPSGDTVKLSPRIRAQDVRDKAIASIPARAIEPFLSRPLIVDENGLKTAPRIIATQEGRVYTGANDTVYVRGLAAGDNTRLFDIFRPGRPLKDPETQAVVAYEAVYLGVAERTRPGDPATFRIVNSKEEIGVGDRLVAAGKPEIVSYVPRANERALEGRVLAIYGGGVDQAASNMVIALNRGGSQGVERGHVLRLFRYGKTVTDRTSEIRKERVRLPDEPYGYVFIFRVFNHISYGLVLNTSAPVIVGDRFSSVLE